MDGKAGGGERVVHHAEMLELENVHMVLCLFRSGRWCEQV